MITTVATNPATVAEENRQRHSVESLRLVSVLRGTGNRKAYMRPITGAIVAHLKAMMASMRAENG